ncbi:MAG: RNA methyltransferase, partial [Dysgonamonadaceae bacterium]|nr:RNA methyltransferase [Dysgonamonadaceae bacterium]
MSLSKNKISYIQSLKQKKYRSQHNTFVAEGSKLIFDLIRNTPCQLLVISDELKDSVTEVDAEEIIIASNAELKKASHLSTPPDAIAVFYQKNHDLT